MIQKLTALGDGFGLVLDRSILEKLGIDQNTPLQVEVDGEGLALPKLWKDSLREAVPRGEIV